MSKVTYDAGQFLLTVDDTGVARALGDLAGKTPAVLKVAINRTARQARRDVISAAEARYALTAKGKAKLRRLKQRRTATNTNLVAELRQDDKGLPLDYAYFEHTPTKVRTGMDAVRNSPKYHAGRVLKREPMKPLREKSGRSKGFLVEFENGGPDKNHIGMVQRRLGVRSASTETKRGYPRWTNASGIVEYIETMNRPGGSSMGRAVWERGVDATAADHLERFVEQRIKEVIDRAKK